MRLNLFAGWRAGQSLLTRLFSSRRTPRRLLGSQVRSLETLERRITPAVFMVPSEGSLATEIAAAESSTDPSNIIEVAAGSYSLTDESIQVPTEHNLFIEGAYAVPGIAPNVIIQPNGSGRVLEIKGNVTLENLTITGGDVQGESSTTPAQGGGLLIDGGDVTLSNVNVTNNKVQGAKGSQGDAGTGNNAGAQVATGEVLMAAGFTWQVAH